MSNLRKIRRWIPAQLTQDGDGVRIQRIAGRHIAPELDPFLLIDELKADDRKDYIGGFPPHPHRGFETITYMLGGRVKHEDHMGNQGVIGPGDVQWMSAGRGVIHSEMPEQTDQVFHGFQLWLNLPADEKMKPAEYRDIRATDITEHSLANTGHVKLIAGHLGVDGQQISGPIQATSTEAIYADIQLPADAGVDIQVPDGHRVMLYVYESSLIEEPGNEIPASSLAIYQDAGDQLSLRSGQQGSRMLLLAGKPIEEPIVQHGPFVMNTQEQINQAIEDYQLGRLV